MRLCEWCGHEHAIEELCTKRPRAVGRRYFLGLLGAIPLAGTWGAVTRSTEPLPWRQMLARVMIPLPLPVPDPLPCPAFPGGAFTRALSREMDQMLFDLRRLELAIITHDANPVWLRRNWYDGPHKAAAEESNVSSKRRGKLAPAKDVIENTTFKIAGLDGAEVLISESDSKERVQLRLRRGPEGGGDYIELDQAGFTALQAIQPALVKAAKPRKPRPAKEA